MKRPGMKTTVAACYTGYVTQAIVNNFAPLLFVTFNTDYGISLSLISVMIAVNFGMQLLVDFLASVFVDRIGYRPCLVGAHFFVCAGLVLLAVLPDLLPSPAAGLFIATAVYGIGGGLIEVLVSPVIESCPLKNKKSQMSLLHSFYCWGQLAVVALSTVFFLFLGVERWEILACVWAVIPFLNMIAFLFVPMYSPAKGETVSAPLKTVASSGFFWVFAFLIFLAGCTELGVSQWASSFAETALGVSKTTGDLLGPCMFALLMGASRLLYALAGEKWNLRVSLLAASLLCTAGYGLCAFAPDSLPWLGLAGCAVVGFGCGIMWPGIFSYAAVKIPEGGTALFALLAFAGDLGCMAGPSSVGWVADAFGGDLSSGLALGIAFPAVMAIVLLFFRTDRGKDKRTLS